DCPAVVAAVPDGGEPLRAARLDHSKVDGGGGAPAVLDPHAPGCAVCRARPAVGRPAPRLPGLVGDDPAVGADLQRPVCVLVLPLVARPDEGGVDVEDGGRVFYTQVAPDQLVVRSRERGVAEEDLVAEPAGPESDDAARRLDRDLPPVVVG